MNDKVTMYLMRHGATLNNLAKPPVLQGRHLDAELSDTGHAQAAATGRFLSEFPISRVFSSPLKRARQTADKIAEPHSLEVQAVEAISEVDAGIWEGMSWGDVMEQYPKEYADFMENAGVNPYLGGESFSDVQRRVVPAFEELLDLNRGRHIAVVAHNVVIRTYVSHLLRIDLRHFQHLKQDNCCVNVIERNGGKTRLVTTNCVFHLKALDGS